MKFFLLLFLVNFLACGKQKSSDLNFGVATRSELEAQKGQPIREEALPLEKGSMLIYPENEKFQLRGDIVTNRFRNPLESEKILIYWEHKFRDCQTITNKLPHNLNQHTPGEIELSCPSEGVSVIYSQGSTFVSRIIEYEKK
jgi:hypothetical protein